MPTNTGPFFIAEEFISPLSCEHILDRLEITDFTNTRDRSVLRQFSTISDIRIRHALEVFKGEIEEHFRAEIDSFDKPVFECYPEGYSNGIPVTSGGMIVAGKWTKMPSSDLLGIIFLKDHQTSETLDTSYEVYGGNLAFPSFRKEIVSRRGTLVCFPSTLNFIHFISTIELGNQVIARFNIKTTKPFVYNAKQFSKG